jgi:Cytochrome P460
MMRATILVSVAFVVLLLSGLRSSSAQGPASPLDTPHYTQDGKLEFPADYRRWIYLSSGIDMSYRKDAGMDHSMFDNVFVNPEAYEAFLKTGTWPDKTMLVLELRMAGSHASINKSGHFQTTETMGHEVHVKDSHFPGGWAFFGFDDQQPAKMIPVKADCYSCHQQHGAVGTTFVQFYPTLIQLAEQKGTLSEPYKKEEGKK